ncbi:Uncharacterised protein [uncultured Clostridium sp.]|nr:Uncharacterised protein [uncultured Clostridium sp.]
MKSNKKRVFHIIYGRTFIIIFLLEIQIYILISAFNWLSKGYAYIYNFQYYHYYISNLYYEQKR